MLLWAILDLIIVQNVPEVALRIRIDQLKRPINLCMVQELPDPKLQTKLVFDFFQLLYSVSCKYVSRNYFQHNKQKIDLHFFLILLYLVVSIKSENRYSENWPLTDCVTES